MDLARGLLEEAEVISRRGGMQFHLADTPLHRALLFRSPADAEASRTALDEAGQIIEACGYKRLEPELAALRAVW